ncbi:MAG TPA: FAD-dependent monooxygenase [Candidatus Lustribacter sp.]|nr:FAD-dependent monooxygenase [Candidatus Lustribacter sp.]
MDADVIVVGAGPTGLMLASELRLAGVRPVVIERRPHLHDTPKANAVVGQILQLLQYRGLLERFEAASPASGHFASAYPFGNIYLRFTGLANPPVGMPLPQPQLERLLDERAQELGAEIRRGHDFVGLRQDDTAVTAEVSGPDGCYQLTAPYLVGCDGPRSNVRKFAGIPFPGTTNPELNRLGRVTLTEPQLLLDNGDLDVPGVGRIHPGFTYTDRGVFAFAKFSDGVLSMQTTEDDVTGVDDDAPLTLTELGDSIRRVLGSALPLGEATRLSRYQLQARLAERYRDKRIFLAGDAAHQFPATGIGLNVGMLDAVNLAWKLAASIHGWAPAGLLDSYHDERHFAGAAIASSRSPHRDVADLSHTARPIFLDLAGRTDLLETVRGWRDRIDIHVAQAEHPPADALLIRPDAHVAWAATNGEPTGSAVPALQNALSVWFGTSPVGKLDKPMKEAPDERLA